MDEEEREALKALTQDMYNRLSEEIIIAGAALFFLLAQETHDVARQMRGQTTPPPPEVLDELLRSRFGSFLEVRRAISDLAHRTFGPDGRRR